MLASFLFFSVLVWLMGFFSMVKDKKERLLITGASGFIGRSLVERLKFQFDIVAVSRQKKYFSNVYSIGVGGITGRTNWACILKGVDVVIHLAALAHKKKNEVNDDVYMDVNVDSAVNLFVQAEKSGVRRFIFMSSISVIGSRTTHTPFNEQSVCNPDGIYARSKFQAEQALLHIAHQSPMELVIVRPPLVFSPEAPGNIAKLCRLLKIFPILPFGLVNNKKSFVSIDNLLEFIESCIVSDAASGQTFVVADDRVLSTKQLVMILAEELDVKVFFIPVPVVLMKFLMYSLGKKFLYNQLFGDLVIDSSKAKKLLAWKASL